MNNIQKYYSSSDHLFLKINDNINFNRKLRHTFRLNDTIRGNIIATGTFKRNYYYIKINNDVTFITRNNKYNIGDNFIGKYIFRDNNTSESEKSILIFKDITLVSNVGMNNTEVHCNRQSICYMYSMFTLLNNLFYLLNIDYRFNLDYSNITTELLTEYTNWLKKKKIDTIFMDKSEFFILFLEEISNESDIISLSTFSLTNQEYIKTLILNLQNINFNYTILKPAGVCTDDHKYESYKLFGSNIKCKNQFNIETIIQKLLNKNQYVYVRFKVTKDGVQKLFNYNQPLTNEINSNDIYIDAHAIVLNSYDSKSQIYTFKNVWGTTWGNNGFGKCKLSALKITAYTYFSRFSIKSHNNFLNSLHNTSGQLGGGRKKKSSKKLSKKKSPKIHIGPRGGEYIVKKGKKIYQ